MTRHLLRSQAIPLALTLLVTAGGAVYGCGSSSASSSSAGGGGAGGASSANGNSGQGGDILPSAVVAAQTSASSSSGQGGNPPVCDPNPTSGLHAASAIFGDAAEQDALAVDVDAQGNIAIAGAFAGTMKIGGVTLTSAGGNDIFVAKLKSDGTAIWAKSFGDAQIQSARGVAFDLGGNVVVTGEFKGTVDFGGGPLSFVGPNFSDVFLVKLNGAQGNHVWSEKFGDIASQTPHAIAIDASDNIAIVGDFQSALDFGGGVSISHAGDADAFVAVFDKAGTAKWAKQFGDAQNQEANAVAFDKSGNVLIAGDTDGAVDFGMGAQALKGTKDAFVAKLTPAGAVTWGKLYGAQKSLVAGIAADATGNILITGDHTGDIDFGGGALANANGDNVFVAKLDPSGAHMWSRTFGDDNPQHAKGISVDGSGRAVVTGNYNGSIDFGKGKLTSAGSVDMYLAKLDTHGCAVWQKSFGDPGFQGAAAVVVDAAGKAVFTGSTSGTVNFGGMPLTAAGVDVFVAAYQP